MCVCFTISNKKRKIVNKDIVREMIIPHSKTTNLSYGLGVWLEPNEESYNSILIGPLTIWLLLPPDNSSLEDSCPQENRMRINKKRQGNFIALKVLKPVD